MADLIQVHFVVPPSDLIFPRDVFSPPPKWSAFLTFGNAELYILRSLQAYRVRNKGRQIANREAHGVWWLLLWCTDLYLWRGHLKCYNVCSFQWTPVETSYCGMVFWAGKSARLRYMDSIQETTLGSKNRQVSEYQGGYVVRLKETSVEFSRNHWSWQEFWIPYYQGE